MIGPPASHSEGKVMKTAASVFVLLASFVASSAFAQDQSAMTAAETACGPKAQKFDAKQDSSQHPTPQADPTKALIYVVQELGELQCTGCALTRLGLDGAWVGANQGSSYFFFTADPGEHHLCLNWQSRMEARSKAFAFNTFTAEAGKVYYFRARIFPTRLDYSFDLDLTNPDEGKFLVASSGYTVSHVKK
jgi:hypothetical protein